MDDLKTATLPVYGKHLDAHIALENYLLQKTGANRAYHDMLSEYRQWLDAKSIPSEGDDGWATREAFDGANVNAFINYWMDDYYG